jgi:glycosyltransferase involved in cell wall biosynthesis
MPIYNCASFLGESVGSVLAQTFRDYELIVVDDGSSDGSCEMLQAFSDKRIRTFRMQQNCGVAVVRNFAVDQADCEHLAFLDADDIAVPERLEIQVRCLISRANLGAVISRARILDSGRMYKQPFERLQPEEISATLLFRNCIVQSTVMMRRENWQPACVEFRGASDYELWARLTPRIRFGMLQKELVTYRIHSGGISKRSPEDVKKVVRQIHQAILERLGVQPKLQLHAMLSTWPSDASSEQLKEAGCWLREILLANRVYDASSLQRVIERLWFGICLDSWVLGPSAFHIYIGSALARLTPGRIARFVRRYGRRAITGRKEI